ncbi:MAG: tetratricopeptide repeat protein [Coleofasciculus sp. S288]|nr:tetratricopeptide repeat protein [Coleofasciculus sp. S288]
MTASPLNQAIENYAKKLQELENQLLAPEKTIDKLTTAKTADGKRIISETENELRKKLILDVLVARDAVDAALADKSLDSIKDVDFTRVIELDSRLKQQAKLITKKVDLEQWRKSLNSSAEAWWWFLTHKWDRLDWLWSSSTLICMTLSFSLLADIAPRFWAGGPTTLGAFAIIGSSVLNLIVGGGVLTQTGREAKEHLLEKLKIPKHWWKEFSLGVTFLLFIGLASVHLHLPEIAVLYNERGKKQAEVDKGWNSKKLASAESNFKRAIAINPDYAEAHYNLGWLYERRQDLSDARTHYKIAMQGGLVSARVRLARLYLLDEKEPTSVNTAVALLIEGWGSGDVNNATAQEQYLWHKTLSWARIKQERYDEAFEQLEIAKELRDEVTWDRIPRDSECLTAMILEGQGKQKDANTQWQQCKELASQFDPDEDIWITKIQQRSKKLKGER